MKDWTGYLKEYVNSDLWGFVLLDYYHWQRKQGYKEGPSHFIDEVISELPKAEIDPVAFHNVLLSVCVHLLSPDFSDIMEKSINLLKGLNIPLSQKQLQSILLHYDVYGKREVFMEKLKSSGVGVTEVHGKSEEPKGKDVELTGIRKVIEAARKCEPEDEKIHPKVGSVIIKNNEIVCEAYRGEMKPGDHAEYTALIKRCGNMDLTGATLITTLEPCTTRKHDKKPCALHIADRGIKKVIVGLIDPNPEIRGKGVLFLQRKNIKVEFFPSEYQEEVINLNSEFWNQEGEKYKIDIMKDSGSGDQPPIIVPPQKLD